MVRRRLLVTVAGVRFTVEVEGAGAAGARARVVADGGGAGDEGSWIPVNAGGAGGAAESVRRCFWLDGARVISALVEPRATGARVWLRGLELDVVVQDARVAALAGRVDRQAVGRTGNVVVVAAMPGRVVKVLVGLGDVVVAEQPLLVVEAMKMENELRAPRAGRVLELAAREGGVVEAGGALAVIGD